MTYTSERVKTLTTVCSCCGVETDEESDSYLGEELIMCEGCGDHYQWCKVCNTHNSDDWCRHVYQDLNGEICGSGGDNWDWSKESFIVLLDFLGVEPSKQLRNALAQHKYHHRFSGSCFGAQCLNTRWYQPDGTCVYGEKYFEPLFQRHSPENAETIAEGVNWLVSLYSGCNNEHGIFVPDLDTPKQDLLTVEWIDEWLKMRDIL